MKPLVYFDLETTGVNTDKDRIIQIAAIKVNPETWEEIESKKTLINPLMPIPAEASEVHGITDDDVREAPTFKQIAKSLFEWLVGCDLGGYNSDRFDLPMLIAEFNRVGIAFPDIHTALVDVMKIETVIHSRKLEDVYKRYTGVALEGAHDALEDVRATIVVHAHQRKISEEAGKTPAEIDAWLQGEQKRVDYGGRLYASEDGVIRWGFGKHKDESVALTPAYANWVLKADFPEDTKQHIRQVLAAHNQASER